MGNPDQGDHGLSTASNKQPALRNRAAIVTGASRGIGRAIANELARSGAWLALAGRDAAALAAVADECEVSGARAVSVPVDLRDPAFADRLVATCLDAYGRIDLVVNNAGATLAGNFLELPDAQWIDGFEVKFYGAVRLSRAAWPHLRSTRGCIVNIAGAGGRTPTANFAIGASVNAAMLALTKALADLGIAEGVRVNAINPGQVRTERLVRVIARMALDWGIDVDAAEERLRASAGVSRFGSAEDIARAVAFVAAQDSGYLQGALIDIDGGMTKSI